MRVLLILYFTGVLVLYFAIFISNIENLKSLELNFSNVIILTTVKKLNARF